MISTVMPSATITPTREASTSAAPRDDAALRRAAEAFEAGFLAEMLSFAGLGKTPEGFGGGHGEDAFASLLVREQARLMVKAGGIGIAETVFRALAAREGGA